MDSLWKISFERFLWLVERDEINGVVNLAGTHPLTNSDFMPRLAWRIRHSIRITSYKTHDGNGCCLHANRNWTFIEESSRCSQKASCEWFQVQLLQLAWSSTWSLSTMDRTECLKIRSASTPADRSPILDWSRRTGRNGFGFDIGNHECPTIVRHRCFPYGNWTWWSWPSGWAIVPDSVPHRTKEEAWRTTFANCRHPDVPMRDTIWKLIAHPDGSFTMFNSRGASTRTMPHDSRAFTNFQYQIPKPFRHRSSRSIQDLVIGQRGYWQSGFLNIRYGPLSIKIMCCFMPIWRSWTWNHSQEAFWEQRDDSSIKVQFLFAWRQHPIPSWVL